MKYVAVAVPIAVAVGWIAVYVLVGRFLEDVGATPEIG